MSGEGIVRDLGSGRVVGKTADMEEAFLDAVRACLERGPHYVVVGEGHNRFEARLLEVGARVVRDPSVGETALILAGEPAEWEPAGG